MTGLSIHEINKIEIKKITPLTRGSFCREVEITANRGEKFYISLFAEKKESLSITTKKERKNA